MQCAASSLAEAVLWLNEYLPCNQAMVQDNVCARPRWLDQLPLKEDMEETWGVNQGRLGDRVGMEVWRKLSVQSCMSFAHTDC